ncbi:hypothetical protein KEM56_002426 [Ascosphaera pollenicola]|nr:hypothetical protein KEM56_002426 [Ascosphaera pollenicola]
MFRRLKNPEDSERRRFYASLVVEGFTSACIIPPNVGRVNLRAPLVSQFLSRLEFPRMKVLTVELESRCRLFKMQGQNVTVLKLDAARRMSPGSYFRFLDKEQMDAIIDQVCVIFPNVETLIIRGVCEISSATIAKITEKLLKLKEFQNDEAEVTVVD